MCAANPSCCAPVANATPRLFTDRAIVYRENNGFDHLQVALSIGIQKMVRADRAGSGVMFTLDTETGFPGVVVINAAWGLGENVVQGTVNPDKYLVFKHFLADSRYQPIIEKSLGTKEKKLIYAQGGGARTHNIRTPRAEREAFVLQDEEILQLARWAVAVETHYGRAMDIEWAKDGETGELYLVQARPETVQSAKSNTLLKTYSLVKKGRLIVTGAAIGEAISIGKACIIHSAADIDRFREGSILVTESTDPDWVPIMKKAAGLITNYGGTTSHAAIVSRELGLPAIVGTLNGTQLITDKQPITLCCAEGEQGCRVRGNSRIQGHRGQSGRGTANQDGHDGEYRQPRGGIALVAPAGQGDWSCAHGIHHQQHHQDSSDGTGALR